MPTPAARVALARRARFERASATRSLLLSTVFLLGMMAWLFLAVQARLGVAAARDPTTGAWVVALGLGSLFHGAMGLRELARRERLGPWAWKALVGAHALALLALASLLLSI